MIKSVAFLISSFMLLVFGETFGQSKWQIGFRSGMNFSSLTGVEPEVKEDFGLIDPFYGGFLQYQYDGDIFGDASIRFSATADLGYKLTDKARIVMGIGYAGRGMHLQDDGEVYNESLDGSTILHGHFSYDRDVKLNYLTVPVNFKYYLGSKNRFFLTVGGYTDFLLSSKVTGSQHHLLQVDMISDGQVVPVQFSEGESQFKDDEAHTSKVDVGLTYGGGFEFPLNSRMNFLLTLCMNHGLNQIDGKYDNDTQRFPVTSGYYTRHNNYYGLNSNARNITLNASIGITYQL